MRYSTTLATAHVAYEQCKRPGKYSPLYLNSPRLLTHTTILTILPYFPHAAVYISVSFTLSCSLSLCCRLKRLKVNATKLAAPFPPHLPHVGAAAAGAINVKFNSNCVCVGVCDMAATRVKSSKIA